MLRSLIERLEGYYGELVGMLRAHKEELSAIREDVRNIMTEFDTIEAAIQGIQTDVGSIAANVQTLVTDLTNAGNAGGLTADQATQLAQQLSDIKTQLDGVATASTPPATAPADAAPEA